VDGKFRAAEDEAHLRAIAVGEDDVPTGFDHVGDMPRGKLDLLVLIGDRQMILVPDQRIAADRHDGEFVHGWPRQRRKYEPPRHKDTKEDSLRALRARPLLVPWCLGGSISMAP
jgi:hypothetical protein